jgi:hypothetical protein
MYTNNSGVSANTITIGTSNDNVIIPGHLTYTSGLSFPYINQLGY